MSDTQRRYRAIKTTIMQMYPEQPTGHREKYINTLVALICGIVGSCHVHTSKIADHTPGFGAKPSSVVKRFSHWIQNDAVSWELCFLPFAQSLLAGLALQTIVLAIDGSAVGRGCVTLMVSVIYKGRALPLAWVVVQGKKGHFPETVHLEVLAQVQAIVPAGAHVVMVGDGEFDGIALQAAVEQYGWNYACRVAVNTVLTIEEEEITVSDLLIAPGGCYGIAGVQMTAHHYGPVMIVRVWDEGQDEPLSLVTNLELAEEACAWYRLRAHIETFFSDQKSRGFHLDKSHVSDPARLSRLMIAACLAYIWIIYLGVVAKRDDWVAIIHRTDRCDLSLFQLGLRLLAYLLKEELPIPITINVQILVEERFRE